MSLELSNLCDKCGNLVPKENSVIKYELGIGNIAAALAISDRHYDPVYDEQGIQICEGSPSRREAWLARSPPWK